MSINNDGGIVCVVDELWMLLSVLMLFGEIVKLLMLLLKCMLLGMYGDITGMLMLTVF